MADVNNDHNPDALKDAPEVVEVTTSHELDPENHEYSTEVHVVDEHRLKQRLYELCRSGQDATVWGQLKRTGLEAAALALRLTGSASTVFTRLLDLEARRQDLERQLADLKDRLGEAFDRAFAESPDAGIFTADGQRVAVHTNVVMNLTSPLTDTLVGADQIGSLAVGFEDAEKREFAVAPVLMPNASGTALSTVGQPFAGGAPFTQQESFSLASDPDGGEDNDDEDDE